MKKILVPVDLTDVSEHAIKYAFQLFSEETSFTIMHAISSTMTMAEPLMVPLPITRNNDIEEALKNRVQTILDKLNITRTFDIVISYGAVVDEIIRALDQEDYEGVVMGKRDKYGFADKLFGTISLGVIKRSSKPIYLIPANVEYKDFKKVIIASDYHLESDRMLGALAAWNQDYRADMHFLHIKEFAQENHKFVKNIIEEYFHKENVNFPFTIIEEKERDIARTLIEYGDEQGADLHIIISDKNSWLNTITSRSISKEMILKADKPLLFFSSSMKKYSQIFFSLFTA